MLGDRPGFGDIGRRSVPGQALLGPGVYFGVLLFNLAVTFYIGEIVLGLCGVLLTTGLGGLVLYKIYRPGAFT
jgi:putative membrane protein